LLGSSSLSSEATKDAKSELFRWLELFDIVTALTREENLLQG
jgi:hypothetical protein